MLHTHFNDTRPPAQTTLPRRLPSTRKALAAIGSSVLLALVASPASADGPGRGHTANFEKAYLQFIIDHHYSALRMTELAAGTDLQRDTAIDNPQEGTAP